MATAFTIYSETDNSLNFYKRDTVPVVGKTFNNRTVTKIWNDFETVAYTDSKNPDWQKGGTNKLVTSASLDCWFRDELGTLICKSDIEKLSDTTFLVNGKWQLVKPVTYGGILRCY